MKLLWTPNGWANYQHWIENDKDVLGKVNDLLRDVRRDPFKGLGKPEPLKQNLSGWWARRITHEHRLIYRVAGKDDEKHIEIASCRYHYPSA